MKPKEKIKGTVSNVFNTLSGKKGGWSAAFGWLAVAAAVAAPVYAIAAAPVYAASELVTAGLSAGYAHKFAKPVKKKGPTL